LRLRRKVAGAGRYLQSGRKLWLEGEAVVVEGKGSQRLQLKSVNEVALSQTVVEHWNLEEWHNPS